MIQSDKHVIDGIELRLTCMACPEQYNAYEGDRQVGYLRYRWGSFTVRVPDSSGSVVLDDEVGGYLDGMFSAEDRAECLPKAVAAIRAAMVSEPGLFERP